MDSVANAEALIASLWSQADLRTELPEDDPDFLIERGPTRGRYDSRRSFHRFHLRVEAILERNDMVLGVYAKDVSRRGIGLLAPVEITLGEKLRLRLLNGANYMIEIVRCNRISDRCFECGARFVRGPRSASG